MSTSSNKVITTTADGPCQACGKANSMSFYRIMIHKLIVIICPFCFGSLSNGVRQIDDESSLY